MGIGMVLAVSPEISDDVIAYMKSINEKPVIIGHTSNREGGLKICHR
jgi:phosphoribosylaminoimidazole (AIR) synthetase